MFLAFLAVKKNGKHLAAAGGLFVLLLFGVIMANSHINTLEAEQKEAEYNQLMANFDIDKAIDFLSAHYGEDHYYDVQGKLSEVLEEKVPEIGEDTLKINEFLNRYGQYAYDSTVSTLEERRDSIRWSDEATAWEMAEWHNTIDEYDRYLELHPRGEHANQATANKVGIKLDRITEYSPLLEFDHYGSGSQCSFSIENRTSGTITILMKGPVGKDVEIAPNSTARFTVPRGEYEIAMKTTSSETRPCKGHETLTGGNYSISLVIESPYAIHIPQYSYY